MKTALKMFLRTVTLLFVVYALLLGGFFLAMHQRPEVFASVMAKTPGITFAVLPFRSMWLTSRAGKLKVGDLAPDFSLAGSDKKLTVQLSSFKGKQPVVLIFGSYT